MECDTEEVSRAMNAFSPRVLVATVLLTTALAQDVAAASKLGFSANLGLTAPEVTVVRFGWGAGRHYDFHGYNFHHDVTVNNNVNVVGNGNRSGGWNGDWGPSWGGVGAGVAIGAGIAAAAAAAARAPAYPPPPPVVYTYPAPYPYPVYGYPP